MRKLLIYLNEYRKECILAPLFKLLEASFELVVPLVVAAIIDHGIAASNKSYIFKMGGVMVLLALIGLACSITAQYFAAKAAVGFSTKVRYALFSHIQKLSFSEMDTIGTSTLITSRPPARDTAARARSCRPRPRSGSAQACAPGKASFYSAQS